MNQRSLSLTSKASYKFDQLIKNLTEKGLPPTITDENIMAIKYDDLVTMGFDHLLQLNADTCDDIRKVKVIKFKNKVFKPSNISLVN